MGERWWWCQTWMARNIGVTNCHYLQTSHPITELAPYCWSLVYNIGRIYPFPVREAAQVLTQALVISHLDYCMHFLSVLSFSHQSSSISAYYIVSSSKLWCRSTVQWRELLPRYTLHPRSYTPVQPLCSFASGHSTIPSFRRPSGPLGQARSLDSRVVAHLPMQTPCFSDYNSTTPASTYFHVA